MAAAFRRNPEDGGGWIVSERALRTLVAAVSLVAIVGSVAISWGAAQARLSESVSHRQYDVDMLRIREDRIAADNLLDVRIQMDSIRQAADRDRIAAQEAALAVLTRRLTQFICDNGSRRSYCR